MTESQTLVQPVQSPPQPTQAKQTSRRQQKVGHVVSDKMQKTRVVVVETLKRHRLYKRTFKQTKRFYVHDERNASHTGDLVQIEESRPMSRLKRWRLVKILRQDSAPIPVEEPQEQEIAADSAPVEEPAEE
jgi:small subunit ribosomal protein S17